MRLMPPRIGSIISGFGYHSTETEVSEGMVALNTNRLLLQVSLKKYIMNGEITPGYPSHVLEQMRDLIAE